MTTLDEKNNLEKFFESATQHHQENELEEACHLYEKILEKIPDSPLVNYNYGLALYELGHFKKSYNCYHAALKGAPDNTDILYNQALCAKKQGDFHQTIIIYKKIIQITPDDFDSLYNLGCCQKDMDDDTGAISAFLKVVELSPDHQSAINNLAYLYHKNGAIENALKFYSMLLAINPDHVSAQHMIASLTGETPATAPSEYIEQVFDDYSSYYEDSLVNKLKYNVPNMMLEHFGQVFQDNPGFYKTLDLGCGTGLAGVAFKDISSSLIGVDISPKMIDIAAAKGIYNSLIILDIDEYLQTDPPPFNLIIAADVFTYIGDLEAIFKLIIQTAEHESYFCFSIEKSSSNSFNLRETGRFAHSFPYIEHIILLSGWEICRHVDVDLRQERGEWIKGMLFLLKN